MSAALDADIVENIEGLFKVRISSHLCNKGKATFDGIDYESLDDVVRQFLKEATEAITKVSGGVSLELSKAWIDILAGTKGESNSSSSADDTPRLLSTSDVMDHSEIAKRKGYNVGDIVFEKSVGRQGGLYQIKVVDSTVQLSEFDPFKDAKLDVKLPFDKFMSKWSVFKGQGSGGKLEAN